MSANIALHYKPPVFDQVDEHWVVESFSWPEEDKRITAVNTFAACPTSKQLRDIRVEHTKMLLKELERL